MDMIMILIYLCLVNIVAFGLYGIDKKKAIKKKKDKNCRRIPEKVLLWWAIIGGSVGSYLGMRHYNHKTKKPLFSIGVPVILGIQVIVAVYLCSFVLNSVGFKVASE